MKPSHTSEVETYNIWKWLSCWIFMNSADVTRVHSDTMTVLGFLEALSMAATSSGLLLMAAHGLTVSGLRLDSRSNGLSPGPPKDLT
jgi:hypothetical protein